jgi:hypothetical protein
MEVSQVEYVKALYEIGKMRHVRLDEALSEQKEELAAQLQQENRTVAFPTKIEDEGKGQSLSIAA